MEARPRGATKVLRPRFRTLPEVETSRSDGAAIRNFGLSAGELIFQLRLFQRTARVHVIIHEIFGPAIIAMRANNLEGTSAETGNAFEMEHTVGELVDMLAIRPEGMRVHVLTYRSAHPLAPFRRHSPRSTLTSGAFGRIAEVHCDTWYYAKSGEFSESLELVVDLDRPFEPYGSGQRVVQKPRALWTPAGWTRVEAAD